jgi:uncharacterized protein YneF (UPF0154 family)
MPATVKKTTPESVKAMLDTLKPRPRISAEAIAAYCAHSGRKHSDPAKLAAKLKKMM